MTDDNWRLETRDFFPMLMIGMSRRTRQFMPRPYLRLSCRKLPRQCLVPAVSILSRLLACLPCCYYSSFIKLFCFVSIDCQITLTQMFGGGGSKETEKTPALDQNEANTTEAAANAENAASSQAVAEDTNDIASDAEESLQECGEMDAEEEEPPVDNIHRLAWRNGAKIETQSPLLRGSGAWSALTTNKPTTKSSPVLAETSLSVTSPARETEGYKPRPPTRNGNYNCAWDALFSDSMDDDDETRMDQLLGLFETEMQDDCSSDSQMCSQQSAFETLPLTQRGESIAETIEEEITSDPVRLHSIEAVCPNWRANIRFALSHRGSDDVGLALERVRRSIVNLQNTKEKVSTVWKRQEVVLELFEAALSASLARLTNGAQNDEDRQS